MKNLIVLLLLVLSLIGCVTFFKKDVETPQIIDKKEIEQGMSQREVERVIELKTGDKYYLDSYVVKWEELEADGTHARAYFFVFEDSGLTNWGWH